MFLYFDTIDALNLPDTWQTNMKGNYTFFQDRNSLHASQKSLPLLVEDC